MDYQLQKKGNQLLLGLEIDRAVMDIMTTVDTLQDCLILLKKKFTGLEDMVIGKFGSFNIRLNKQANHKISLFIDGPDFDKSRVQSAALYANEKELISVLEAVLSE